MSSTYLTFRHDNTNVQSAHLTWLVPLTVVPGVAILINSAGMRLNEVYQELIRFAKVHRGCGPRCGRDLLFRVHMLRNSLIFMYLTVCCFALAATFPLFIETTAARFEVWLYRCGMATFLLAALLLVADAAMSASLARYHYHNDG